MFIHGPGDLAGSRDVVEVRCVFVHTSEMCVHISSQYQEEYAVETLLLRHFDMSPEAMAVASTLPVGAWVTRERRVEARYARAGDFF